MGSEETECDDITLALFSLEEDGRIGELIDVYIQALVREGRRLSRIPVLHSCTPSPGEKFSVVCDKGLDRALTFRIHEGRLDCLQSVQLLKGRGPSYSAFHPSLPVVYTNYEDRAYVAVWAYRGGRLFKMAEVPLLSDPKKATAWHTLGPSDIIVSVDGKTLYVLFRVLELVCVLALDGEGLPTLIQTVDCQGKTRAGFAWHRTGGSFL